MNNQKPREFWLVKGTPDLIADSKEEMIDNLRGDISRIGCEIVHTIEHRAYDEAMTMLKEAILSIDNYCNANSVREFNTIEGSNEDQFIKVLRKFEAWKEGK